MKKPVQSTTEKATLTTEITPQNFGTQVLSFARKTGIKVSAVLAFFALASCSSTEDNPIEPVNKAPTVTLTNIVSDDATNTVSGKFIATDSDGTITQKTLQAEATDGTRQNITLNADGTFSHILTGSGKVFDALLAKTKDDDNATDEKYQNLTPTVEVEMPNVDSTVANPNVTVDENSTNDINLGVEDANGLASTVFKNESTNELATYFNLIDNTKLQVKTDAILNHEVDSQIQGEITITDNLGNQIDKTITINLNDLQEQQIIDLYGDGGLLPNGEAYAVKADEEATGETLPVMYYNHGTSRRTETQIQAELDAADGYGDAQDDISDLYGTGIGPEYSNGQDMVSFDGGTNEMVIHAEDGSELNRLPRAKYSQMMRTIMGRKGTNNSIQFVQDGTELNAIWEEMIVKQSQLPNKLSIGTDISIQSNLTE